MAWRLAESFQFCCYSFCRCSCISQTSCQIKNEVSVGGRKRRRAGRRPGKFTLDSSHGSRRFWGNCVEGARSGDWSSLKVGPNEFPARVSRLPVAIKMAAPQMRNSCGCACAQFNWPGASNYAIVAVEIDRKQASNNFEFISERHNLCRNSI